MRRAVITGIGAVTPIGIGKDGLWNGVLAGKSAISRISHFDPSEFRSQIAAEVRGFDPSAYIDTRKLKRLDRFAQFAVASAQMAVQDASLNLDSEDASRIGVAMGSALGGIAFAERQYGVYRDTGLKGVDPTLALCVFCGAGACNIAMDIGVTGPGTTNSNSCASGTAALGEALNFIRHGYADVMLAGASEAPLSPLCYGAFSIIRAMSSRNDQPELSCRPFDRDRDGFVMAEGAAVLVIEEMERAVKRGAHIYAELMGASITNDAYHMTAPHPEGRSAIKAMTSALSDANVSINEIDYINAHGSGTPLNDSTETLAIKSVFGDRAKEVPISSTKAMHGHALGATGAFEAAICALAIENGYIPPTINLENPDNNCDLDYVPYEGRNAKIDRILSNSFGFGGINACAVFGSVD